MTTVNVFPGNANNTHDISLSDGNETYGLLLESGERSMQETPMTPPARSFSTEQVSFTGGRGKTRFATDQMSFFDSKNAWTLQENNLYASPRADYAIGVKKANYNLPDEIIWKPLFGSTLYSACKFVPSATYSARKVYLWVRKIGAPGTLTVRVHSDTAGSPGTVLETITTAGSTIDEVSRFLSSVFTARSFTSGTTYWISAAGASGNDLTNHWEIGAESVDDSITKTSANGSTWSAATWTMHFRIVENVAEREIFFFYYYGATMAVTKPKAASGSQLFINGDIGRATSGAATSITDTAKSWTTNVWANAYVRIVAGKGSGQARQIASNTATALTVSDAWEENPDNTSRYAIYDTNQWAEVTGHGLTKVVYPPVVVNRTVYFAQGDATNMRRMTYTTSFQYADDGTNKADALCQHKNLLYKALDTNGTSQLNLITYATPQNWGTDLTFAGSITAGSSEYQIMTMVEFDSSLYIVKQDSVWRIQNNVSAQLNLGIEALPDMQNGKSAISFGNYLNFPLLHSIEQLQGSTLNDIGWWRHDGMPINRDGQCSGMVGAISWLFAALDGVGAGKYSALLCYNQRGWHELFRSHNTGERIRNVFWQANPETTPRLWFSCDNEIMGIRFPANSLNPLKDTSLKFHNEAVMITATLDAGNPTFTKIIHDVEIESIGLDSNNYIAVDYQVDSQVGSTSVNSWREAGKVYISPSASVSIEDGSIKRLRLRFRVVSKDPTGSPPQLVSYQINGHVIEPPKYQWNMRIKVAGNQSTLIGAPDHSPDVLLDFFKKSAREMRLLRMRTKFQSSDDKAVYISSPTVLRTANNLLTKLWDGSIVVTIREA